MRTIAIVSEHASPLGTVGGVDAGGQNIYVASIARQLARLGLRVGPQIELAKERLLPHMPAFLTAMNAFAREQRLRYDVVHANFFMSGWVGLRTRPSAWKVVTSAVPKPRSIAVLKNRFGREARLVVAGGNSNDPATNRTPELERLARIAQTESVADRVDFIGRRDRDRLRMTVFPISIRRFCRIRAMSRARSASCSSSPRKR